MNPHDDLGRLLRETGDSIEPGDRLDRIRDLGRSRAHRPLTVLAPLAAAAAVAVVVGVVVGVVAMTGGSDRDTHTVDPLASPSSSAGTTAEPPEEDGRMSVPVYYAGETAQGLRLFREFQSARLHSSQVPDGVVDEAVTRAVLGPPKDPDYRSLWPAGTQAYAQPWDGDVLTVVLEPADASVGDLRERPVGMSEEEARLAVQQLVYSGQAALQEGRVPVRLLVNGESVDTVLGVPVDDPLGNDPVLETLSLVSLTTPGEGDEVGEVLDVEGVANAFEGTVVLSVLRDGEELLNEPLIADGWMGARLFPFRHRLVLDQLAPGTYTLQALVETPDEDHEVFVDTRTIILR